MGVSVFVWTVYCLSDFDEVCLTLSHFVQAFESVLISVDSDV